MSTSVVVNGETVQLRDGRLDLRYKNISRLEEVRGLYDLDGLRVLILEDNQLQSVPGIRKLKELKVLNIADNRLKSLDGIGDLTSLEVLALSGNDDLRGVGGLEALVELRAFCGGGSCTMHCMHTLSHWPNLKLLNYTGMQISGDFTCPDHANLTELQLRNNKLRTLSGIGNLPSLRVLNVDHNLLESLDGVDRLPELRVLFARWNRLTSIAPLSKLQNLQHLRISFNDVTDITAVTGMRSLGNLYAGYNRITNVDPLKVSPIRNVLLYGNPIQADQLDWLRTVDDSISDEG